MCGDAQQLHVSQRLTSIWHSHALAGGSRGRRSAGFECVRLRLGIAGTCVRASCGRYYYVSGTQAEKSIDFDC